MKTLMNGAGLIMALALLISVSSCEKDETTEPNSSADALESYIMLGTQTTSNDVEVKLYSEKSPFVGYNRIAVRLKDNASGEEISTGSVMFRPIMDMGMMLHTTPVQHPIYSSELEAYNGSATFIMPSTAGTWTFGVIVDYMGATDTVAFNSEVVALDEPRLYSFISAADSATSYFVALKEPMNPKVGVNDFELMIYQRASMMSFPPVTNLKLEIEPEMPGMGHGSPNNVNPVHVEDGLYRGKVNFTMSGYWKVGVEVKDENDVLLDNQGVFDITFQ